MVRSMCLTSKNDSSRSIAGLGALMVVACLAGPALVGAIGALVVGLW
jgi:hypothetical protein